MKLKTEATSALVLKQAECDGLGSMLLDVQRDCIKAQETIAALESGIMGAKEELIEQDKTIAALRSDLKVQTEIATQYTITTEKLRDEIDADREQKAEISRLRAALENIKVWCEAVPTEAVLKTIQDSARAALGEEDK